MFQCKESTQAVFFCPQTPEKKPNDQRTRKRKGESYDSGQGHYSPTSFASRQTGQHSHGECVIYNVVTFQEKEAQEGTKLAITLR